MDLSNTETNNIEEHNMCDISFVNIAEGILLKILFKKKLTMTDYCIYFNYNLIYNY